MFRTFTAPRYQAYARRYYGYLGRPIANQRLRFSPKYTFLFGLLGCGLSWNESLLDLYSDYTHSKVLTESSTKIEFQLRSASAAEGVRTPKGALRYTEMRSWNSEHEFSGPELHLLEKALSAESGIRVQPYIFMDQSTRESICFYHLGYGLSGYPFIIHGGILATLVSEVTSGLFLYDKPGQNANLESLELTYVAPALANTTVIVRTLKPLVDEDREIIKCTVETLDHKVLTRSLVSLKRQSI